MRRLFSTLKLAGFGLLATTAQLAAFTFPSIDGGEIDLSDWSGQPVLVVNTASLCGFTYQYDGLQALYDRYRDAGLVVLAVPSNDFNQELASGEEVKQFCAINFNLDLPMAMLSPVTGADAHPFYAWVRDETGFAPNWNFNKVLIGPDGEIEGTWRSSTKPQSPKITRAVEAALTGS
jgi:glutathione peroxidase